MLTSVEWLMNKYRTQNGVITAADYHKAKEIEKKQKKVDYQSGYLDCYTKYKINERKFNT
jgi:hypothetical protein